MVRPNRGEFLAAHVTDASRDAVVASVAATGGVELTCDQLRDPRAFKHVAHPLQHHLEAFCAAAGIDRTAPSEPGAPCVWDIAERAWALLVQRHLLPRLHVDVVLATGPYNSAYARYVDGLLHNDDRLDDAPVRSVTATGDDVAAAFCDVAAGVTATCPPSHRASTLTAGLTGLVGRRVEVRLGGDGDDDQFGRLLAVTDDAFVLGDDRDDTSVLVVPRDRVRTVCTRQLTEAEFGALFPGAVADNDPGTDHPYDPPAGPDDAGPDDAPTEEELRDRLAQMWRSWCGFRDSGDPVASAIAFGDFANELYHYTCERLGLDVVHGADDPAGDDTQG